MPGKNKVQIDIEVEKKGRGAEKVEDALKEARAAATRMRKELDKLDGLPPGLRKQAEGVATSMERVATTGAKATASQKGLTKSTRNSGRAALEFSRAVEDAQFGITGVLNNIPGLIQALGGGAGLAGVISLAAVALTQLGKAMVGTGETAVKLREGLKGATEQIDEFYERAARDGTAGFREKVRAVTAGLTSQNDRLQENVDLIQRKRSAELALAAIGDDAELANVALQQASGGLTDEEANERRRAVEVRRINRAAEEKILAATEALELAQAKRAANAEAQVELDGRIARAKAKELELIDERNRLQTAQELAEREKERGQKLADKNAFFSPLDVSRGRDILTSDAANFSEESRARLEAIEKVLLPQRAALVSTLEGTLRAKEEEQGELSRAQGAAFQNAELVRETEARAVELREEILETNALAKRAAAAGGEVSAGVETLGQLSESALTRTETDRRLIADAQRQIQSVVSDGVVTTNELAETNRILGALAQAQTQATGEVSTVVSGLQRAVQELQRQARELRQNQVRLNGPSGR